MNKLITLFTLMLIPTIALASDEVPDVSGVWTDGSKATFTLEQDGSDISLALPVYNLTLTGTITKPSDGNEFLVVVNGEKNKGSYVAIYNMAFAGDVNGDTLNVSKCLKTVHHKTGVDVKLARAGQNCVGTWAKN